MASRTGAYVVLAKSSWLEGLTNGNKYNVTREGNNYYHIVNDKGELKVYDKCSFDVIISSGSDE